MSDMHTTVTDLARSRLLLVTIVMAAVVLVALVVAPAALSLAYDGRIYPGVSVAGIDLAGQTPEEAAAIVAAAGIARDDSITLVDPGLPDIGLQPGSEGTTGADDSGPVSDDRSWTFTRGELGLGLDGMATADAAYSVGREESNPLGAWFAPLLLRLRGVDVAEDVPIDMDAARAALVELAPEVDVAPRDADVRLADGQVVDTAPLPGRQLDIEATLGRLAALPRAPGPLTVEVATSGTAPRIGDLGSVTEAYEKIISGPVLLKYKTGFEQTLSQELIESWVTVRDMANATGQEVPSIVFDEQAMWSYVAQLADEIDRPAAEARYEYDIDSGTVSLRESSEAGLQLDVAGTANAIIEATYTGPRVADVAVRETLPRVNSRAISNGTEGFTELAGTATRVSGAPEGRIRNILVAADRFNGIVIPKGEEFSFNTLLGAVDEASGYSMAQFTIQPSASTTGGLDGGIDQVAATAFRAAFWAGLPITERRSPKVRVGWVEPPVGLDAAAGTPGTDFRFVNDTSGYLLISAEVDALRGALVWKLYGLPRERRVDVVGPDVTDLLPARDGVVEIVSAAVAPGEREQIGWAREGATATVRRTVFEDGAQVVADAFVSQYEAASDVVAVGAGE
ncbi:MAG: VanW family protein [Anaerolineae bacterium]